jgi:thiol-disulfide isomerase/thioredoxin
MMVSAASVFLFLFSDPLADAKGKTAVVFFLSTECPVSSRYAPELRRLHERFARSSVVFYAVYPNAGETETSVRSHVQEFQIPGTWLRDPLHTLVRKTGVRVTPEAAVLAPDGRVVYRGRIDDRYTELGKMRPSPTHRDLEDALEAVTSGRAVPSSGAPAVGCSIQSSR